MANQTATAADIQTHILPNSYASSSSSQPQYSLGGEHISVSAFSNVLQPAQFQSNALPRPSPSTPSMSTSKRKQEDDEHVPPSSRKRRVKVFDVETSEVVSGEPRQLGARHWTDGEKGKLFNWLLGKDDHWEAFSTQMNTVFRDGAICLFDSKKTFTALKSCYHRNVETFKQIYAFERYLIRVTTLSNPGASPLPGYIVLPKSFEEPIQRQSFLDRRLETARSQEHEGVQIGVGNLSSKVVDHWCAKGWYLLFKRRFREDPVTGQISPYFGRDHTASLVGNGISETAAVLFLQPDPPDSDEGSDDDADSAAVEQAVNQDQHPSAQETHEQQETNHVQEATISHTTASPPSSQQPQPLIKTRERRKGPAAAASNNARFRVSHPPSEPEVQAQAQVTSPVHTSFYNGTPVAAYPGYPPHAYPSPHMFPPPSPHFDYNQPYPGPPPFTILHPQLQQLTHLAQNLINTCTTLVDLLRTQAEDGKERLDLLKKKEERERAAGEMGYKQDDGLDRKERVTLATQVLANADADEEVRQAAKEFLKRLFA